MSANNLPIFTGTPSISGVQIGAANVQSDGSGVIGTNLWKAFGSGPFGSYVSNIIFSPTASVPATATAPTVLRTFISNLSSGVTNNTNCWLINEIGAAAQTADQTTTAIFPFNVPLNFALPSGYSILVSTHVGNVANTAWSALVFGGNY